MSRLKNKLRQIQSHILFLIETKVSNQNMEKIWRKLGFVNAIDVASLGSRGGLSLGWKEDTNIVLRSFSNPYIDVEIIEEEEIFIDASPDFMGH